MNRAEQRRAARRHGWRGTHSKKGVPLATAVAQVERELAEEEYRVYVEKIQAAARATRDMGLLIPGQ